MCTRSWVATRQGLGALMLGGLCAVVAYRKHAWPSPVDYEALLMEELTACSREQEIKLNEP